MKTPVKLVPLTSTLSKTQKYPLYSEEAYHYLDFFSIGDLFMYLITGVKKWTLYLLTSHKSKYTNSETKSSKARLHEATIKNFIYLKEN